MAKKQCNLNNMWTYDLQQFLCYGLASKQKRMIYTGRSRKLQNETTQKCFWCEAFHHVLITLHFSNYGPTLNFISCHLFCVPINTNTVYQNITFLYLNYIRNLVFLYVVMSLWVWNFYLLFKNVNRVLKLILPKEYLLNFFLAKNITLR